MSSKKQHHCPICHKTQTWDTTNPWRPFCSQRCKQVDLGNWASGAYAVAGDNATEPSNEQITNFIKSQS